MTDRSAGWATSVASPVPPTGGPAALVGTSTRSARRLPAPDSPAVIETPSELAAVLVDLERAAVWTARGDRWQEHARFLLGTRDGRCHLVGFTDPIAAELVPRLRALPGFDSGLLLELTGSRESRVTHLWAAPQIATEDRPPAQIPAQRGLSEPVAKAADTAACAEPTWPAEPASLGGWSPVHAVRRSRPLSLLVLVR